MPTAGRRADPCVPFVGLAEALVLSALRRSEVPLQRIRPALAHLQREIVLDHALAPRRLSTDGAELLFDGESHADTVEGAGARTLVVVRSGQRVFATSSRTCCVSHPDALPDLFLDRSLGRIVVPSLLRAAGLRLTTLVEHYKAPARR